MFPSFLKLYREIVKLLPNQILKEILVDLKRYLYFTDCIKALNGIYLLIFVKGGYIR